MKITFDVSPAGALSRQYALAFEPGESPASAEVIRHITLALQEASRKSDAELERGTESK
jgi:hypothetical protein